ncbi:MAG: PEP-CTERM sorting domain-containing protein [Thermoguttaceae bacterium]
MRRVLALLVVALVCGLVVQAKADYVALSTPDLVGNQTWTGNLGLDFNVASPIWVTALGAYDSSGNGFSSTITVGLYQRSTTAPPPLTAGNPSTEHYGSLLASKSLLGTPADWEGDYRYVPLSSAIQLQPGDYSIVAVGFGSGNPNGNENISPPSFIVNAYSGSQLSFVGTGRYDSKTTLDYPYYTTAQNGYPNVTPEVFAAGSFEFSLANPAVIGVPEPTGIVALLGLAGMGLIGLVWRRRAAA